MEPIVGVICEYDPFHRGHARQFELIRAALPGARILCVMSGCFTQRGSPALFSPAMRAEAALRAGASIVLELPCAFALREAENFAMGGVGLLNSLGCVTHLSFGCETDNLPFLQLVANVLEQPTPVFSDALKSYLATGVSFATAQANAIASVLSALSGGIHNKQTLPDMLVKPNNILGICYLRALMRLQSKIIPLPVKRIGEYHASSLAAEGFPSASATRKAFLSGNMEETALASGYSLAGAIYHPPQALDKVLIHTLRTASPEMLRALPDCSEGLENRVLKAARDSNSRAELLSKLKTKRYAYARLNRLLSHALLGAEQTILTQHATPPYARLLGYRRDQRDLFALLKQSGMPLLSKMAATDRSDALLALDMRAYDLWALGADLPAGLIFSQKIAIV